MHIRSRSRDRSRSGGGFFPGQLFTSGAQGAWYDPSDFSTLYQNAAGTTPVTAVEQPVRLMLDRSRGLVLGAELDPGFSAYQTVLTGTWGASGSNYVFTDTVGGQSRPGVQWPSSSLSPGWYEVTIVVAAITGAAQLRMDQLTGTDQLFGVGAHTFRLNAATAGKVRIRLEKLSTAVSDGFSLASVSVRELPGNHAVAPNDASRPVLRSRYNLLTYSEQFDNGAWLKQSGGTGSAPVVTANAAVAPDGTMTADQVAFALNGGTSGSDLSVLNQQISSTITVTGSFWVRASSNVRIAARASTTWRAIDATTSWQRVVLPADTGAGLQIGLRGSVVSGLPDTATVELWGAQLLTAADETATGGAYQRVGAATDYDTGPPWRPYLAFDGSDDSMSTSSIDFSGTDKMTVFAGVSKLSDAASAMLVELSANAVTNVGAFNIQAPVTGGNPEYRYLGGGSTFRSVLDSAAAAPRTDVLTATQDISGDAMELRRNGVSVGTSALDQGTGNFGNYALFIGRRNNSSTPFNGRLYGLTVLGRTATAPELTAMESWIAGKTGVSL